MKIQSTLPPTAAPIPFPALVAGLCGLLGGGGTASRVSREIGQWLGASHVCLLSSGKAALALILETLSQGSPRRKVIVPAYTCFSVPSAIRKARLEVVPCDVNPITLDFKRDSLQRLLDDQTLCVLTTHLFGLPADVDAVISLCRPLGIFVVEDAAQAMGARSNGRLVGTIGDLGLFSLGRGKNLSCGGGGVVVTRDDRLGTAMQDTCAALPKESRLAVARTWAESAATTLLTRPQLYWFPAGLPFLGLGETKFYRDFPMQRMEDARAATLAGWRDRLETDNAGRRERAEAFIQELKAEVTDVQPVVNPDAVYLRLPILVRNLAVKQAVLRESVRQGLGLSQAYPGTIAQIPELDGHVAREGEEGAKELVARLVTLPTHRYVTARHRRAICRVIQQAAADDASSRRTTVPEDSAVVHERHPDQIGKVNVSMKRKHA